ncbi:MAG: two-component regulator propeller domain-containing protein [Bacteroidota bacterium]
MKRNLFRLPSFFLLIASVLLHASACISQSKTKPEVARKINSPIDTDLRLRFTSGVRAILEDSHGNIWFGSNQEGICRFDGESLTYFTLADGLSNNQVRSIYEDANGVVWFECGKGLSRYNGGRPDVVLGRSYSAKNDWQSTKTDLWFKGDEMSAYNNLEGQPGVYRYDGKECIFQQFPLNGPAAVSDLYSFSTETPKINLSQYSVSTPFVRGKHGRLWFGTYGAVFGYDGTNFTTIDDKSLGRNEENGYLHVRSIFEDSQGRLWIGNNGIGVMLYEGDSITHFSEKHHLISENSGRRGGYRSPPGSLEHVFSIGEDADGNIWFGDRDTGAWRFDGETFQNYTIEDGLTTTHIWQIYRSKAGELWFALSDGSVSRFMGQGFERIF